MIIELIVAIVCFAVIMLGLKILFGDNSPNIDR